MAKARAMKPKVDPELAIYKNLMAFMDRVQVTGRQEVGAYAEAVNFLASKIGEDTPVAQSPAEEK